jgi:hypothetical protein
MPTKPQKPKKPQAATPADPVIALAALRCLVDGVDQAAIGAYIFDAARLNAIVILLQGVITELTHLPVAQAKKDNGGGSCDPPFTLCDGGYCTMTGCFAEGHGEEPDN